MSSRRDLGRLPVFTLILFIWTIFLCLIYMTTRIAPIVAGQFGWGLQGRAPNAGQHMRSKVGRFPARIAGSLPAKVRFPHHGERRFDVPAESSRIEQRVNCPVSRQLFTNGT
jgi:hypothetical protein